MIRPRALAPAFAAILAAGASASNSGPWDLATLKQAPAFTWVGGTATEKQVLYEGETFQGRPTRVFALYCLPASPSGKVPAMVLLTGAGGCVQAPELSPSWTARGYATLEIDLGGCGPAGTTRTDLPPEQVDGTDIGNRFYVNPADPQWYHSNALYHTVASIIRGVSFLRAQPEVDTGKIGVSGGSWGGYHTCMAAGLDDRLKLAIPQFGSGYYQESSYWSGILKGLPAQQRDLWTATFDPKNYLPQANMPFLWITGVNDPFFFLDSWYKSGLLPRGPRYRRLDDLQHDSPAAMLLKENYAFADFVFRGGPPLVTFNGQGKSGNQAWATYSAAGPSPKSVALWYSTSADTMAWTDRVWKQGAATLDTVNRKVGAAIPAGTVVCFIWSMDAKDNSVSSELINVTSDKLPPIPATALAPPGVRHSAGTGAAALRSRSAIRFPRGGGAYEASGRAAGITGKGN